MKKLAIILTITALGLHVKGQVWVQSNGPEGGAISEMVCTDNDKTVMAKVSNVEKTMFTTDYGDNWEKETVNSPGTLINFHEAGGVLFAYAQGIDNPKKFYRSADGGKNWSEISDLPDYYHGKVFEYDGALYGALGKNGNLNVFKSTDKGVTWTDMNSTGFSYGGAKFIFPSDSMLIAVEGKDAFYSEDNGKTFTKSTDLGEHVDEYFVHNGTAYLGQFNEKAIYYSEDDGKTWQEQAMTIDPSGFFSFKGNLYAIGDDNIFIMEGHGATLTPVFGPELEGISVASATKGGSVAWLATQQGVLRSTDGLNWTFANKGLGYASINAFDILNGDTYFMASEAGVWRSKSYGERWIPKGLLAKTVTDVQVANSKVYAAAHKDYVYVSDDEGETWSKIGTGFPADALSPTLATDGSHLYCHVEQGTSAGVYKLTNFTGNWEKVLDNTSSLVIWANDTLILTGEKYSKDQGATWSDINGLEGPKGSVNPESYVTTSNGDFYAGAFRKVAGNPAAFKSNNGTNFSVFDNGIENNTQSVVGLLNRNDTIYASSYVYVEGNDNNDNHTYYLVPGENTWTEFGYASIKDVPVGRGAFTNTPYGILLGSVKGVFRYDIETIPEVPDTVDQIEYPPLTNQLYNTKSIREIIKVYPNPASDVITIQSKQPVDMITIVNQQGMALIKCDGESIQSIDVSNLSQGIYVIRIEQDGQIRTKKIIIY